MTAPKVGDWVRVAFDATYHGLADGRHVVKILSTWGSVLVALPADAEVEILRPPVAVGDVIETAEQAAALPANAVVLNDMECALQTDGAYWYPANIHGGLPVATVSLPATVIYLPDGAA